jgi:hypothetical protein
MAAPAAIIEHGSNPAYDIENETGLLASKVTFKVQRTKVTKKSAGTRATTYARYEDPLMTIGLEGVMIPSTGAPQGVAVLGVGAVATLANFGSDDSMHGFLGTDTGLIILDDAERTLGDSEDPTEMLNYTVFPYITA